MSDSIRSSQLIRESVSRRELPRVPEPESIMHDPAQIAAFEEAGREDGILAFIYFFHALQMAPVVRPGDRVLDLACGPANQLVQAARLNPRAHFVGLDASANVLDRARATLARCAISNVDLVLGDMTRLSEFDGAAMDCVTCTMSLHHLPDQAALAAAMREVRRVLKPGGGLYLVDFGRLRRASTQRFFAQAQRASPSEQFTQDYLHSLRAAFSVEELSAATAVFGPGLMRHQTALAPFMVVFKSVARRELDAATELLAREMFGRLTAEQQSDFHDLARWFGAAGFGLPCAFS